jgi:hypothetical protein
MHPPTWLIFGLFAIRGLALPSRGHYPFTIALCNYPDMKVKDLLIKNVRQFFTSAGADTPGLYRFIQEQSHGTVDFEGTQVNGWFTTDASYMDMLSYNRQQRLDQCRDAAARAGFVVPPV